VHRVTSLQYAQHGVEVKYYADGEDGLDMRKVLSREIVGLPALPGAAAWTAPDKRGQQHALPPAAVSATPPPAATAEGLPQIESLKLGSDASGPGAAAGASADDEAAEIEPGAAVTAEAVAGDAPAAAAKKSRKKKR
jgi:hypothetical protein